MDKYYVQIGEGVKQEITVEQFVQLERSFGFRGPGHQETPPKPATGGFGSGLITATIEHVKGEDEKGSNSSVS